MCRNLRGIEIEHEFGWKHFFPEGRPERAEDCLFLILYRNPLDWLRSLHRIPWHTPPEFRNIPFSEFIRKEWHCVYDKDAECPEGHPDFGKEIMCERDPDTGERFANVLKMRSAKIRRWQALAEQVRHFRFLRYEDLYADPKGTIDSLAEEFGLRRRLFFRNVHGYKGWLLSFRGYRPKQYRPVAGEDLAFIREQLDMNLERSIGYEI